ncbi:MAG: DEAD/DEAH box helicase family protein [Candidatus Paceibacterota bacterium]
MTDKVTLLVGSNRIKIIPKLPENVFDVLRSELRFRVHGYQYTDAFQRRVWDGYKQLFLHNQTAPVGLYLRTKSILERNGINVEVKFKNDYNVLGDRIYATGLSLNDLQIASVRVSVDKRICTITMAVRGGKTAVLSAVINYVQQLPVFVITQDRDLVKQTVDAFKRHTNFRIGHFSEGEFVSGDVVVASYKAMNSMLYMLSVQKEGLKKVSKKTQLRYKKVLSVINESKMLLLDECHVSLSEKTSKAVFQFPKAGYRISVTGTYKADNKTMIETEAVVGPVVYNVGFEELISIGRLARPVVILYSLPNSWYNHYLNEWSDIEEANIVNNNMRNRFIAETVLNLKKQGKSSFITVSKLEHGEILNSLIPNSYFVRGSVDTDTRFSLYEALQNGGLSCIISTVSKIGLNLPKLDAVINAEGVKSKIPTIQRMRSLTSSENKETGLVIDFIDSGKYLFEHSCAREDIYMKLKGFTIKHKKVNKDFFEKKGGR